MITVGVPKTVANALPISVTSLDIVALGGVRCDPVVEMHPVDTVKELTECSNPA